MSCRFDALANKLPPMLPRGGSALVDAEDVATGMLRAAEIGRSGERYILSGDFAELSDIIARAAHPVWVCRRNGECGGNSVGDFTAGSGQKNHLATTEYRAAFSKGGDRRLLFANLPPRERDQPVQSSPCDSHQRV